MDEHIFDKVHDIDHHRRHNDTSGDDADQDKGHDRFCDESDGTPDDPCADRRAAFNAVSSFCFSCQVNSLLLESVKDFMDDGFRYA